MHIHYINALIRAAPEHFHLHIENEDKLGELFIIAWELWKEELNM